MADKYILTKRELEQLLVAKAELEALEQGGVDNWEWYEESIDNAENYDRDLGGFDVSKQLEKYEEYQKD